MISREEEGPECSRKWSILLIIILIFTTPQKGRVNSLEVIWTVSLIMFAKQSESDIPKSD